MATTTLETPAAGDRGAWMLDWLTTVDHKKIGILYIVNSFLFFFAAGILALVIRTELAVPGMQFLDQDTYNQAFTMHGTIMVFLFIIPVLSGFANYSGKHLELTVPDLPVEGEGSSSFTGCVGGKIKSWVAPFDTDVPGDAFYGYTGPGYSEEFWILDVEGTRLMVAAERSPGSPAEDLAELRAILDSIRIEP